MRTNLSQNFAKINLQPFYPVIALWVINLLLVGCCFFGVSQLIASFQEYTQLETEVTQLQAKVDLVNENRKIDPFELDRLTVILSQLIPDSEDSFLVISTLERLSSQTGFSLERYTVNIPSSTDEKLSLTIDGSGDSESFLKLLSTYQYGGGRLVTNEELEFSPTNLRSVRLTLNFYHKRTAGNLEGDKKITQKDFELIRTIEQKMNTPAVQSQ